MNILDIILIAGSCILVAIVAIAIIRSRRIVRSAQGFEGVVEGNPEDEDGNRFEDSPYIELGEHGRV